MLVRLFVFFSLFVLSACGGGGGGTSTGSKTVESAPLPVVSAQPPENLNILVIGQSIASNCNQFAYGPSYNVWQIGRDGSIKPAQDPFEWADCDKGSMWMPLGTRIVGTGIAKQVTFMPIGVGGSKVADWQAGGIAFKKLNDMIALVNKNGIKFDFAIWHQGSADAGMSRSEYSDRLKLVIAYVEQNISIKRWLIGIHSRCGDTFDPEIEAAQRLVADAPTSNRYLGANTNLLGEDLRFDRCHLSQQGQEQAADLWLSAIRNASVTK